MFQPNTNPIQTNKSKDLARWYVYPDDLPSQRFAGFSNREDQSFLRGSFVVGQNFTFGTSGLPANRKGFEVVGTEAADSTPVRRAWVYETRDGTQYELKIYDTKLVFWLVGTSTDYSILKTGLTANTDWGFANIGRTSDATMYCIFSNGTDGVFKFSGANTTVASTTINTITKSGTNTWTQDGFASATNSVVINGVEYSYTGGEGTTTLTGVTPDPTGNAAGSLIVQAVETVSALSGVKGSVLMAHDGRLHMRLDSKKSIWNFSKLDDPFNFTVASPDEDGNAGSKEIEFSGPITAFGKLNKTILCFKKRQIKLLDFTQVGSRVDLSRYQTLVSADDKGTTLGAMNQKCVFSTPLGMVFLTADKRLALLSGVTANNEPQYMFISDPIQPIFNVGVWDDAVGICVDNVIYLAFKQDENSTYNDTVLRGDMTRQSIDTLGRVLPIRWDSPTVGWNVSDWTVTYNTTTGKNDIHWHSSINSGSYKLIDQKTDAGSGFTTTIRTWAENMGFPTLQKKIEEAFIEIRMTENTTPLVTLLYDEDGFTSTDETQLTGTGDDVNYRFGGTTYNPFGATSFGSEKFGSNTESNSNPVYRFHIEVNPNIFFYNISMQISTDGDGQDYEVVRFGYKVTEINPETDRKYLKA